MAPTIEDQRIMLRLMARKDLGPSAFPPWESAAAKSAWNDAQLMQEIERRKADTRRVLMMLRVHGRFTQ